MSSEPEDVRARKGHEDDLPPHPHVAETIDHILEHEDPTHVWIADKMDAFIRFIGHGMMWANGVLIGAIILQVVLRYGFNSGLVVLEELQWHLYAIGVMFGVSYAVTTDAHIRVDVLYHNFSDRTKRIVEIVGILIFLLPFCWVIFDHSLDFLWDSWRINERSDAPTGLPARWAIKAVIPISFGLLGLAAISRLIRDTVLLFGGQTSNGGAK